MSVGVVINLMPKFKKVEEWLGSLEAQPAHFFSLSHVELHNIILFLHKKSSISEAKFLADGGFNSDTAQECMMMSRLEVY
jgi:hypothetical protein